MLIEFSISNFRSFREKQTFSMVAAPRLKKKDCVFDLKVKGGEPLKLLKVAAIYGPNASGKSTLIEAMQIVRRVIGLSDESDKLLPVTPFRFDKELIDKPTEIEIHFLIRKQRYEFRLAITKDRIIDEQLFLHPSETPLYKRTYENNSYQYFFSSDLEGGKELHKLWTNVTNPKRLFISQAVKNSSEEFTQLRHPYDWLTGGILPVNSNVIDGLASYVQHHARQYPEFGKKISGFLQSIDVPVTKIKFDVISNDLEEELKKLDGDEHETIEKNIKNSKTTLTHKTVLGEADFDFDEESMGTKNLIGFWLPWDMISYKSGRISTLLVDELDASLHPNIVENLVEQHIKANEHSQLIFTTHDTHLMDTKLLRRDQLWLTERDMNGATRLTSIYEYEGRESEDIEKRYFEGRYKGLPILRKRF